ncbi:MAG TPA: aminotransferase class V-fold PLP-dependent enzyme [Arenimonas sp.]|nr:aminotransferase class V-fold PLP-dependent enzyme [Arenimonas sp.]
MAILHSACDAFVADEGVLYLDCAAQGPRLRSVHDAAMAAMELTARPWNAPPVMPQDLREQLRSRLARLFDDDADAIALVPSAAYGLATAARNLPLGPGDEVLVLDGQFPSNLLCWQQRCAEVGAGLRGVRREAGQDWTDAVLAAIADGPRLRIATLPQVRWDDGAVLDLDRITAALQARDIRLVLDLSQSLGVLPVDLARWRPDFVASVGYKWLLGARGLACLWVAPRWRTRGSAIESHWYGRDAGPEWRFALAPATPFAAGARRYDAGGLDGLVPLTMALAAIDQVLDWQPAQIAGALKACTGALDEQLDRAGLSDWRTPGHAPHITALRPPVDRVDRAFKALRQVRIACTNRYGLLRIAPHLHVAPADMARVVEAIVRVA